MSQISKILDAAQHGDRHAAEELLPLIYEELRKLAAGKLANESPGQTLQPTALVHEAYLRLVEDGDQRQWDSRGHFFAAAAEAMRRILVENARRKQATKHGGDKQRVELNDLPMEVSVPPEELLCINDALESLAEEEPKKADLVKLRYFAGLTLEEAAKALDISRATASKYWTYARAWLYRMIGKNDISS